MLDFSARKPDTIPPSYATRNARLAFAATWTAYGCGGLWTLGPAAAGVSDERRRRMGDGRTGNDPRARRFLPRGACQDLYPDPHYPGGLLDQVGAYLSQELVPVDERRLRPRGSVSINPPSLP